MSTAFTPINQLGEFGLIDRMEAVLGPPTDEDVIVGIADDAAVYRVGEGMVHVVTTDALIEGIHFDRHFMPMEFLGYKSISVNVSDVVAMNALPRYATVSLGLPRSVSVEMVEAFYRGVRRACDAYDMAVIGGDTTSAHALTVSVTAIGEASQNDVVFRRGARPGDALCVTGDLGSSYAGLKVLAAQRRDMEEKGEAFEPDLENYQYVIRRHLTPGAQVAVVRDWAERGVRPRALIDVSDGLGSEVHHICNQSSCGAVVYAAALPIALETRDVADEFGEDVDVYALFGGEDYELVFALDVEKLDPAAFNVVGEFTGSESGVHVQMPGGEMVPLGTGGYDHFSSEEDDN